MIWTAQAYPQFKIGKHTYDLPLMLFQKIQGFIFAAKEKE